MAATARELEEAGVDALRRQALQEAFGLLLQAADQHLAEGRPGEARRIVGNVIGLFRGGGRPEQALSLVEHVLELPAEPANDFALVSCASLLDLVGDPRAEELWLRAGRTFLASMPLMDLNCRAHAAGAAIAQSQSDGLARARAVVAEAPQPALQVGLVGAVGDSAGKAGVPFLAQAVWLMLRDTSTYNSSNAPFLRRLIDRLPPEAPLVASLLGFGLFATYSQPERTAELKPALDEAVTAVAKARNVTLDAMVAAVKAADPRILRAGVELLVPRESWLVSKAPLARA